MNNKVLLIISKYSWVLVFVLIIISASCVDNQAKKENPAERLADASIVREHLFHTGIIEEWQFPDRSRIVVLRGPRFTLRVGNHFTQLERFPRLRPITFSDSTDQQLNLFALTHEKFNEQFIQPWAVISKENGVFGVSLISSVRSNQKDIIEGWELIAIGPDGEEIRRYPDGSIQTYYPDGTEVIKNPDGSVDIYFPDGNIIQISPDGSITFIPSDDITTLTVYPDGSVEIWIPGEDAVRTFPNGDTLRTHPDKSETLIKPDGTKLHIDAQGDLTTTLPDGTEIYEEADDSYKRTTYPSGIIREVYDDDRVITNVLDVLEITLDPSGNTQMQVLPGGNISTTAEGHTFVVGDDGTTAEIDLDGNITVTDLDGNQNIIPTP